MLHLSFPGIIKLFPPPFPSPSLLSTPLSSGVRTLEKHSSLSSRPHDRPFGRSFFAPGSSSAIACVRGGALHKA